MTYSDGYLCRGYHCCYKELSERRADKRRSTCKRCEEPTVRSGPSGSRGGVVVEDVDVDVEVGVGTHGAKE